MTEDNPSPALQTALAYHRSWTSGDLDGAMAHVADDIVCRAPDGEITGKDAYYGYLRDFLQIMTGLTDLAAFGNQEQVLLFYYPHTVTTRTAPAAEHFTIRDGQIVESRLVFDRLSFAPPQQHWAARGDDLQQRACGSRPGGAGCQAVGPRGEDVRRPVVHGQRQHGRVRDERQRSAGARRSSAG